MYLKIIIIFVFSLKRLSQFCYKCYSTYKYLHNKKNNNLWETDVIKVKNDIKHFWIKEVQTKMKDRQNKVFLQCPFAYFHETTTVKSITFCKSIYFTHSTLHSNKPVNFSIYVQKKKNVCYTATFYL